MYKIKEKEPLLLYITSKICPCVATGEKYQIDVTYLYIYIYLFFYKI